MSWIKHTLNERFWSRIDTEEKAYSLGLLCSDGGIVLSGRRRHWYIMSTDFDILEKVKVACQYSGPLYDKKVAGRRRPCRLLQVARKCMVDDLLRLGLVHDKSVMEWVGRVIPQGLVRHFCRGLCDGDGCISVKMSKGYPRLVLNHTDGSRRFVEGLGSVWCGVVGGVVTVRKKQESAWAIEVSGARAKLLLDWMYAGASIYMDRKYGFYRDVCKMRWRTRSEACHDGLVRRYSLVGGDVK